MENIHPIAFPLLLTGIIFLLAGALMYFYRPKKMIEWFGYRTFRSMKNRETWEAGNKFSGKIMMLLGLDMIFICAVAYYLFPDLHEEKYSLIALGIIIFSAIILFLLTENHLKKKFDENGNSIK